MLRLMDANLDRLSEGLRVLEDISRFISLQFHQGLASSNQILRGSTIREMHKLQWVLEKNWNWGYGIGWVVSRYKDYTLVGHSGDMLGFSTNIKFIPHASNMSFGHPLLNRGQLILLI